MGSPRSLQEFVLGLKTLEGRQGLDDSLFIGVTVSYVFLLVETNLWKNQRSQQCQIPAPHTNTTIALKLRDCGFCAILPSGGSHTILHQVKRSFPQVLRYFRIAIIGGAVVSAGAPCTEAQSPTRPTRARIWPEVLCSMSLPLSRSLPLSALSLS